MLQQAVQHYGNTCSRLLLKVARVCMASVVDTGPEPGVGLHHTSEYSSPEVLNQIRAQLTSNMDMYASDVWSLGCLLAWALTGVELFGYSPGQRHPDYQHRLDYVSSRQRPWVRALSCFLTAFSVEVVDCFFRVENECLGGRYGVCS